MTPRSLPVRTLASGQTYTLDVYTYVPEISRGTVYLQAALHGAEIQGLAVIHQLVKALKERDFPYTVKWVSFANPHALDTKVGEYTYGRFDPKTGVNWNRGFKNVLEASSFYEAFDLEAFVSAHQDQGFFSASALLEVEIEKRLKTHLEAVCAPEEKLALLLHLEALKADYVFDLHCDSVSVPYLYTPAYLVGERLRHFQTRHFIQTEKEFSPCFNQAIFYPFWVFTDCWNALTGESQTPPKHAFTYELGSKEHFSLESAKELSQGILAYIQNEKSPETVQEQYVCEEKNYKRIRAEAGGVVEYQDSLLGSCIPAGMSLAALYSKSQLGSGAEGLPIQLKEESILLTRTSSPIVHEGDEVLKVMTRFKQSAP